MTDDGGWLIEQRINRIADVLRVLGRFEPAGLRVDRAEAVLWEACGGPRDEVERILEVALTCRLITERAGAWRRTKEGRRVATQDGVSNGRVLGMILIRSGLLSDQAVKLGNAGAFDADGSLKCERKHALGLAPQLVGILRRWPSVESARLLRIPPDLVAEITSLWALRPQRQYEDGHGARLAVGERAELYSYNRLREELGPDASLVWVSREDDGAGYDIEDRSIAPPRRIEVKGHAGPGFRFYVSANEWNVAHDAPHEYEIHYWGEIDLARAEVDEYPVLVSKGYPMVYRGIRRCIGSGLLRARPDTWVFTSDDAPPAARFPDVE